MAIGRWFRILVVMGVCAVMFSGCRAFKRGNSGQNDMLDFDVLNGDVPLSQRFEDLQRVTDVVFSPVHFAYDSFQIADNEVVSIEAVADYMRRNGGVKLVTEGHCDERGSREYNIALGEHRALAVRAQLVGLGVDGERIQTRSFGEEQPLDPGHNESAWRLNRRVEFVLYR